MNGLSKGVSSPPLSPSPLYSAEGLSALGGAWVLRLARALCVASGRRLHSKWDLGCGPAWCSHLACVFALACPNQVTWPCPSVWTWRMCAAGSSPGSGPGPFRVSWSVAWSPAGSGPARSPDSYAVWCMGLGPGPVPPFVGPIRLLVYGSAVRPGPHLLPDPYAVWCMGVGPSPGPPPPRSIRRLEYGSGARPGRFSLQTPTPFGVGVCCPARSRLPPDPYAAWCMGLGPGPVTPPPRPICAVSCMRVGAGALRPAGVPARCTGFALTTLDRSRA